MNFLNMQGTVEKKKWNVLEFTITQEFRWVSSDSQVR